MLIKWQTSLMLSFTVALFIEISSPISLTILWGVCMVGFSTLTQVKATFVIQWNYLTGHRQWLLLVCVENCLQKSWPDPNVVIFGGTNVFRCKFKRLQLVGFQDCWAILLIPRIAMKVFVFFVKGKAVSRRDNVFAILEILRCNSLKKSK